MKRTRIVLTIAGALVTFPLLYAQTTESTQTTKPASTATQTTQATLNSNPRQTPYSALLEQQPAKATQGTQPTETTHPVQTTSPRSASPLSEGVGGVGVLSVGDTVVIRRDNPRYMTGERISTWVYDVMHTVRQVDSKYHPNGILVDGINSWVSPEAVEKKGMQTKQSLTPDSPQPPQRGGSTESAQEQPATATTEPMQVTEPAESTETTQSAQSTQTAQGTQLTQGTEPAPTAEPAEATSSRSASPLSEGVGGVGVHRFTIGLRGGYANTLSRATDATRPLGYDVMLDLQYAHYWAKVADKCQLGLLVGVGVGYLQSGLQQQALSEQFTANTSDGNILYTITADNVTDKTGQVQLEVPVMFSMITPGGFFLNAGPRILLPVYTPSHQTITNPDVDAYFEEEGVHVVNELVTGVVTDAQQDIKAATDTRFKVNILLGAELGYEFRLQSGHSIGLGAYANYGVWSAFRGNGDGYVFNLTAPEGANNAAIDIMTLTNAKATKIGYLDAGIKLSFHLNWRK